MGNKKKIPVLTQDIIPVIGKEYYVKVAIRQSEEGEQYVVPLIGELHNDKQFGVDAFHYHIDGRFMSRKNIKYHQADNEGRTNVIIRNVGDTYEMYFKTIKIEMRRMKCQRSTTGLKLNFETRNLPIYKRYYNWYESMIGKSCAGKRCPHLGHTMIDQGGQLVCPLHNLIGDKATNKIIAITKKELPCESNQ